MKMNKCIKIGVLVVLMLFLTGCKSKYGFIPSKSEVKAEVDRECINESYTYVSKEKAKGWPREVTYTFVTEGRGLEFHGISTLEHGAFLGNETAYYEDDVSCDYAEAVADLYRDDIINVFKQVDNFYAENNCLKVDIDCDVDEIVDLICQAQEIYAAELEYNTEDWLIDNPAYCLRVIISGGTEEFSSFYADINGIVNREKLKKELQDKINETR